MRAHGYIRQKCVNILTAAFPEDLGSVNSVSDDAVIDRNKIFRGRKRSRCEQVDAAKREIVANNYNGLYFDDKRDETLFSVKKGVHTVVEKRVGHARITVLVSELLIPWGTCKYRKICKHMTKYQTTHRVLCYNYPTSL